MEENPTPYYPHPQLFGKSFVGFHTDISLFGTNLVFMKVLITNFKVNSGFDIPDLILISSTKK